jgi:asparagine synthase (glutamine-hydrolysing)
MMFVCALRPGGEPLRKEDLFGPLARMRGAEADPPEVLLAGPFAALTSDAPSAVRPLVARSRHLIAVGDVRLDNRRELAALAGLVPGESDLALLLRLWEEHGERCIAKLVGDFGFVVWDARAHKLVAVRDAFGVKPLYQHTRGGLVAFSSHASPLHHGSGLDHGYLVAFMAGQPRRSARTLWRDVRSVDAGTYVVQRGTVARTHVHWTAEWFEPRAGDATRDDVDAFRTLLGEAVRAQMGEPGETWAHLSGGLDSSSITALAAAEGGGLGGTLTVVDSLGTGDERAYSDRVVEQYGLRNEQVADYWAWQDDGLAPPRLDQPWPLYPFYARDRRVREVVRDGGARVVLAGVGADHYLTGNLGYIRDMLRRRELRRAAAEISAWSTGRRTSFWTLAGRLLPVPGASGPTQRSDVPGWVRAGAAHTARGARPEDETGAWSSRRDGVFARGVAHELAALAGWFERLDYGAGIEVRYPFLYRPLVEFSLALPRAARIRPLTTKWVLREAMKGTLPEEVRTRGSKGGIDARVLWSLQRERARIDALLRAPGLERSGIVCAETLRRAVAEARNGICANPVHLMSTLALETWFAVQAGTLPLPHSRTSHAA